MVDKIEIQKKRFDYINKLYEESGADRFRGFTREYIGGKLGLDAKEAARIADYLQNEGLIDGDKDFIYISINGIKEVEAATKRPQEETGHFPANIINVGQMIGSQILQASPGATQVMQTNVLTAEERQTIEKAISLLKKNIDEIQLPADQKSDLQAEIDTTEAQLRLSKPTRTRIVESVSSIKGILQPLATGSTIVLQIIQLLSMLHH